MYILGQGWLGGVDPRYELEDILLGQTDGW